MIPPDSVSFSETGGREYRTRYFSMTDDWRFGDLLNVNGDNVVFVGIKLVDQRRTEPVGSLPAESRWRGSKSLLLVIDVNGLTFVDSTNIEDMEIVARFSDVL